MGSLIFSCAKPAQPAARFAKGFTLLELLIVLVIAGVTLGMVTLNAMPGSRQHVQEEAQRIALLLQVARDEAILRNMPIAFEAHANGYRFLIRNGRSWQLLQGDELLREREFAHAPLTLRVEPVLDASAPSRIVFGREPVSRPFRLLLTADDATISIRADGVGHYVIE